MSRSTTGRPSSSSRTAPPTTHATWPASSSRASSRIEHASPAARRPARVADSAGELVVDRARDACVLLEEQAVADDRDRHAYGQLAGKLDGDRVHRDSPHHPPTLAVDQQVRP